MRGRGQDVRGKEEVREKKGENQGKRDRDIYERGEDGEKEGPRKITVGDKRQREKKLDEKGKEEMRKRVAWSRAKMERNCKC